jgi:acetyl-CoA synthetase
VSPKQPTDPLSPARARARADLTGPRRARARRGLFSTVLPDGLFSKENPMIPVKESISRQAKVSSLDEYRRLYQESIDDPQGFWGRQAERLTWFHPPDGAGRWDYDRVDFAWYEGGKLNACFNCVDRHVAVRGDATAVVWAKDEPGEYEHVSYRQLQRRVARVANVLKAHGVGRGDRVCIYLPMIPDLAYAMLACARIGAVHSIVFAGFSAESLRDRILDADCRVVVTANEGLRGGKTIPLKATVDAAVDGLALVDTVLVARRTAAEVAMTAGRDHWLDEETARQRATCPAEWMDAEDPLFVLYTSGSTGKPKGVMHTTGGYMVYASLTHEVIFDLKPGSVYACVADVGWITGHSYIVYGPLANGATTVMFESTPLYPDPGRYWRLVDDLGIDIFYTAPTAIRAIAREGDEWVTKYSRKSLRILGTVGEPINPEIWQWYHDVVGDSRCAVVDTWWQTETGGILITPLPGATPTKPGSATLPFFGVEPQLVDDDGKVLEGNDVRGNLCIARSWPGQARTLWGDHERFRQTYFSTFAGKYFTGDGCRRDEDGYYWITGRVDDVLNVSGHRMGTAEVESALVAHDAVAEAAVVGFPHEIKGQGIYAYVIVTPEHEADDPEELVATLKQQVRKVIGPIATPDRIQVTPGLPKTRSGKIMRRILRKIAEGEYDQMGDITTLAEPAVVATLIEAHKHRS